MCVECSGLKSQKNLRLVSYWSHRFQKHNYQSGYVLMYVCIHVLDHCCKPLLLYAASDVKLLKDEKIIDLQEKEKRGGISISEDDREIRASVLLLSLLLSFCFSFSKILSISYSRRSTWPGFWSSNNIFSLMNDLLNEFV